MRFYTAFLTVLLAFAFIGCSTPETKTAEKKTDSTTAEKAETAEKGETKEEKTEAKPGTEEKEGNFSSPKETIATLVAGIKKKDAATIKSCMSKASVSEFEKQAKKVKKPLDELLVEIFEEEEEMKKVPEMKNEKIDGDNATLDIKDSEMDRWDTVPFVKEDGAWKIAFDKAQG